MATTVAVAAAEGGAMTFRQILTLAFVEKGDQVLLGMKKRGFGHGRWNGFGGKVEAGENVRDAAARELKEECGLTVSPTDLEQLGLIHFLYENNPRVHEVHVFGTKTFSGELVESEEMAPKWWDKADVPYDVMWPDDKIWYPIFFKGTPFRGMFFFKEGYAKISGYQVTSWDEKDVLASENWDPVAMPDLWERIKALPVFTMGETMGPEVVVPAP